MRRTPICGDDAAARAVTREPARGSGFDVLDAGPPAYAVLLESLTTLWIHLAYAQGMGRNFAFKLLKR